MQWITCENTYEESWRRLMEFANIELAIDTIESNHGKATSKTISNYKKQAEQIRASLLQAKEYFEAARASSLFTQPNHLYYGSVALSTACMLIIGDGSKSLDVLRRNTKNAHHGLDFTFSSDIKSSKIGMHLLENSFIKICPNGHFSNWYETLIAEQPVPALVAKIHEQGQSVNLEDSGSFDISSFTKIVNTKRTLSGLIEALPDLVADLGRYGITLEHARGEHKIKKYTAQNKDEHIFTFHHAPSHEALMSIIEKFSCNEGINFSFDIKQGGTSGQVKTRQKETHSFSYPGSRETLDHKTIFYKKDIDTPEVIDLYLISYALSMLSRYFPDIWISFLESHCKGAKLAERVVRLILIKTPNLMLNQISGTTHIISNHRPFWH